LQQQQPALARLTTRIAERSDVLMIVSPYRLRNIRCINYGEPRRAVRCCQCRLARQKFGHTTIPGPLLCANEKVEETRHLSRDDYTCSGCTDGAALKAVCSRASQDKSAAECLRQCPTDRQSCGVPRPPVIRLPLPRSAVDARLPEGRTNPLAANTFGKSANNAAKSASVGLYFRPVSE
jgi:hypothetical protein